MPLWAVTEGQPPELSGIGLQKRTYQRIAYPFHLDDTPPEGA